MSLQTRLDDPPVVLLATALFVAIHALVLSIGGRVGAAVAVGAAAFGAAVLAWRFRLASPAAVAVALAGGVVASSADLGSVIVVAVLPVLAAVAGLEYAVRRLAGRTAVRLSRETEFALAGGTVAGVAWAEIVHAVLPASDDFSVVVRDVIVAVREVFSSGLGLGGVGALVDALAGLVYVVSGPILVVGLAVALASRFRLATPLLFAAVEVGSFLAGPNSGDSVGSLASLVWVFGVPLLLAVAAVELWLRTAGRERLRAVAAGW